MLRRFAPPIPTLALLGLLALVSLGFADRWQRQIDISALKTSNDVNRSAVLEDRTLPPWDAQDPLSFAAIVTAPLFVEGRIMPGDVVAEVVPEPVVEALPPAAEPVAAPPPALNYGLVGVMIADGQKKALLAHASTGAEIWVNQSDLLASWSVEEIARDRVVLTNKGTTKNLVLYPQ